MQTQRRVIGIGLLLLVGMLVLQGATQFALGIHDASSLPHRIVACDRDWTVDSLARAWTGAEIAEQSAGHATVVNPGPLGLFTACPFPSGATVDTVIFIRVDLDAYVDYALSGGP